MIADLKPYAKYKESGVPCLGQLPEHWEVRQARHVGRLLKGVGGTKEDAVSEGMPCIRYGALYTTYNYFIRSSRTCIRAEHVGKYTPLEYGDVLFAASGETIEDIGKSAVYLMRIPTVCGGDVIVLRPSIPVHAPFLGYAMDCRPAANQKAAMARGTTVKHIYPDELRTLSIALPPPDEQPAIVRFLDWADGRLERAIRAKQKVVALLNEQKLVIIHRAVTRGLNPGVPLKASGLPWLGDIPQHWEVHRIVRLARLESGHTPSKSNPAFWRVDNDIPWVSLRDTKHLSRNDYITHTHSCINQAGLDHSSARLLPTGVVVFTRDASVGKAAITTRPMAVSQHLIAWVCGSRLSNEFLLRVFYAMKPELERIGCGATIATIGMDDVRRLVTPLPPRDEQDRIVSYIRSATGALETAVSRLEREIEVLGEYRTRLITDVVTGKLDVRETAAGLPEEAQRDALQGDPRSTDEMKSVDEQVAV